MPDHSRKVAVAALATLGLSSLTPVQQVAMLVTAGAAGLWATPALAQNTIPGVGVIVKSNSGRGAIIVPSDANGEVRLIGLEPGDYTLQVPCSGPAAVAHGRNATSLPRCVLKAKGGWPSQLGKIARALPLTLPHPALAQTIAFASPGGHQPTNAVVLDMRAAFHVPPPIPCARPRPGQASTCGRIRNHVDVNASSAVEMTRNAATLTSEAARVIVAERIRAPFTDAGDFVRRVCPKVEIDFDDSAVRLSSTSILMKWGGDPTANGFKCGPREETVRLFWVTFSFFNLASWL